MLYRVVLAEILNIMSLSVWDFLAVIIALVIVRWLHVQRTRAKASNLPHPPGPPGLPLIGNLRDIPPNPAWLTYRQWSREYCSALVRLNVFGNNIVVVNSLEAVTDLLEKRSSVYSDRPEMTMLNELCGFGWGLAFQRYNTEWRDARRVFHQEFHPQAVRRFRDTEEKSTHQFLRNLLDHPDDVMAHLRLMAGSEIMRIAYGINVESKDDPYIVTAEHAVGSITATTNAGSYLVDTLPFLKHIPEWFPGATFKREAKIWRKSVMKMLYRPFDVVKNRMVDGDIPECVATSLLEGLGKDGKDPSYMEGVIRGALGSMYTGGADTTVSALGSFFLAMVLYPDVQVKARKEIHKVMGYSRLPNFSDYSSLPYIHAIVKESLRWNPVVPLAVPHRSTSDDVYNGFFLPEGTLVVGNTWAILHDESVYPEPMTFNPDRFMKDGELNPEVRDPATAAFGYGRRICPGRFMAYESMWIAIAATLAVYTIEKAEGPDGTPITPNGDYEQGFLCYPKPFPCKIYPHHIDQEVLIRATARI